MQKVIFVGLLSLSMCLCAPTDPKGAAQVPAPDNANANNVPKASIPPSPAPHVDTPPAHEDAAKPVGETAKQQNETAPTQPTNKTNEKKEEAPKDQKEPAKDATKEPAKEATTTKPDVKPTEASAKTEATTKPEASTEKAASPTPKADVTTPKATTTAKPKAGEDDKPAQTRKFDGPSFIGGIIMTLGLLAISFMGYKYYKNQTERNYHTL